LDFWKAASALLLIFDPLSIDFLPGTCYIGKTDRPVGRVRSNGKIAVTWLKRTRAGKKNVDLQQSVRVMQSGS